jgi:hypothetical protein
MRARLRIDQPCAEDWGAMRPTGRAGVRLCDTCRKAVHEVSSDQEAGRIVREARARKERFVCMRVAVATVALVSCAPVTQQVRIGPLTQPPLAGGGAGICAIDPSACSGVTFANYQDEYVMGAITTTEGNVLDKLIAKVRRMFRRSR